MDGFKSTYACTHVRMYMNMYTQRYMYMCMYVKRLLYIKNKGTHVDAYIKPCKMCNNMSLYMNLHRYTSITLLMFLGMNMYMYMYAYVYVCVYVYVRVFLSV